MDPIGDNGKMFLKGKRGIWRSTQQGKKTLHSKAERGWEKGQRSRFLHEGSRKHKSREKKSQRHVTTKIKGGKRKN